jgi:hypothetical protein
LLLEKMDKNGKTQNIKEGGRGFNSEKIPRQGIFGDMNQRLALWYDVIKVEEATSSIQWAAKIFHCPFGLFNQSEALT